MALKVIGKGAEADIYLEGELVIKNRTEKTYRVKDIDEVLRVSRTKKEARLISAARQAGVATPFIRGVNMGDTVLKMTFIDGIQVKKKVLELDDGGLHQLFFKIGQGAGKLHKNHIIHGDMTTSNMILKNGCIYFIDFGLGEINESIEAKGTDLLVFKKTLHSTHYSREKVALKGFIEGYKTEYESYKPVLERLAIIEKRGRYFADRE